MTHYEQIREKLAYFAGEIAALVEPYYFCYEEAEEVQRAIEKLADTFNERG